MVRYRWCAHAVPRTVTPGISVTPSPAGHNARNAPGIIGVYAINPGVNGSMLPLLVYSMYALDLVSPHTWEASVPIRVPAGVAGTSLGHITVYLANEDGESINLIGGDRWSAQLILSY